MNISLTAEQEQFVQAKLETGQYRSAEEIVAIAFQLLDEYERAESEWAKDVREKIDAAIVASAHTPPVDGETFVGHILERFQQSDQ
ncbi:MAG: type II toxin-antitoxin system ParD family antitoxin [Leptolyngbyaceae cyanobacterium]